MSVLDRAPLTVCIDFKNPHAYLANDPTWALINELAVDVQWLPFAASPLSPPPPDSAGDDRGTRHRRHRAAYVAADLARYAGARGLALADPYRDPDVRGAGALLLAAADGSRTVLERYVRSVFDGHWRGTLPIEDRDALVQLWREAGGDPRVADAALGDGLGAVDRVQHELVEAGIFNVPAYVVDGEIYYGRAHLPMIRWLLTGKAGPAPL